MLLGGDTYLIQIEWSFGAAIVYIHVADANDKNCNKTRSSQTAQRNVAVYYCGCA